MKISNETKVGILAAGAIALLIVGFNFLKGRDVFKKKNTIYAIFENVGSLDKSNPVKILGLTVGHIDDIEPLDKDVNGIKVTIAMDKKVNIPDNSVAYIEPSLLGTPVLVIQKGNSSRSIEMGQELKSVSRQGGMLSSVAPQLEPVFGKISNTIDTLNLILGNVNTIFDESVKGHIRSTLAQLDASAAALSNMLQAANGNLTATLGNANSITANIAKSNDSITAIISNAKRFTGSLASVNIGPIADSMQVAVNQLKGIVNSMSSTKGSLGALINDRELYDKINNTVLSAEILLDDLRAHPKRYVNISVFGRKDKGGALTSPLKKDTVRVDY
ncbi:MlaD family protein [Terrimonas ferruginea]|uniref:MlaD family protein n=1 Tax=Terrimonas ferruginea TaxID=249 RepID=UPI000408D749|nr:MlaD family protein [Terrimonas ferruginea]